jgi:hypothetical protein
MNSIKNKIFNTTMFAITKFQEHADKLELFLMREGNMQLVLSCMNMFLIGCFLSIMIYTCMDWLVSDPTENKLVAKISELTEDLDIAEGMVDTYMVDNQEKDKKIKNLTAELNEARLLLDQSQAVIAETRNRYLSCRETAKRFIETFPEPLKQD